MASRANSRGKMGHAGVFFAEAGEKALTSADVISRGRAFEPELPRAEREQRTGDANVARPADFRPL